MPRTKEQIQAEYGKLCAVLGHNYYRLTEMKRDIEETNRKLLALNLEAMDLEKGEGDGETRESAR